MRKFSIESRSGTKRKPLEQIKFDESAGNLHFTEEFLEKE